MPPLCRKRNNKKKRESIMLNETYRAMLGHKSVIRETFMYGKQRAAETKYKNVTVGKLTLDHVNKFAEEMKEAGIVTDVVSPKLLPDYARRAN